MTDPDALLADLVHHPAWKLLAERGRERMEARGAQIAREFLEFNKQPVYASLQYDRGFFAGIKFLIDQPTLDAKKLERALAEERGDDA